MSELKNEVFMNIQLTRPSDPFLKTICDLFKQYDMYETAYFVTDNYDDSLRVRAIDPEIETCPRNRRIKMDTAELERQKKFGTRIIQPGSRRTSRRNSAGKRKNSGSMRICSVPIRTKTTAASFPGDSAAS